MIKFLPTINDYLEENSTELNIPRAELEELVYYINSYVDLEPHQIEFIIQNLFKEIRKSIANGEIVKLHKIGKMYSKKLKTKKIIKFKFLKNVRKGINAKL